MITEIIKQPMIKNIFVLNLPIMHVTLFNKEIESQSGCRLSVIHKKESSRI